MIKQTKIHLFFDITCSTARQAKVLAKFITSGIGGISIPITDRDAIKDVCNCAICGPSLYFEGTYTSYCFNDDIFLSLLGQWDAYIDHELQAFKLLVHQLTNIEGDISYYACYEYNKAYKHIRCSYLYHDNEASEGDTWMYDAKHTDKSMATRLLKEEGKERIIDLSDSTYWAFSGGWYSNWHHDLCEQFKDTTQKEHAE